VGGKMVGNRKVVDTYEKMGINIVTYLQKIFVTNFRHILGDEGIMTNTGHKLRQWSNYMIRILNLRRQSNKRI
jgi:hypothetical protein